MNIVFRLWKKLWKGLWHRLALYCYRRWVAGTPDKRVPVGVPGIRDPEAVCTGYAPRRRELGEWPCWGDGHYLCRGDGQSAPCAHFVPDIPEDAKCPMTGREHNFAGGGDYGSSPPTICCDCGTDIEDLSEEAYAACGRVA